MVLPTVIKGLGKAYLKGKGKKLLGGKSVDYWKNKMKQKKFTDAIKEAGEQVTGKLKKTAASEDANIGVTHPALTDTAPVAEKVVPAGPILNTSMTK